MSYMHDEIQEQPAVLARLLDEEWANVARIGRELRRRECSFALMAARGTSDNAARYGQYVLGAFNGLPVGLATPSLYTMYRRPPQAGAALVIGISQSGASPDVVEVLNVASSQGAATLAITNEPASPLATAAEYCIPLHAGKEQAVAATKTYSAELLALAMLSVALSADGETDPVGENGERLAAIRAVPDAVAQVLADVPAAVSAAAARSRDQQHCVVIGRGFNYATAFEVALKCKELAQVWAEPYSPADFEHGPIALVEPGLPVLLVMPDGAPFGALSELAERLQGLSAELLVISDRPDALQRAAVPLRLPVAVPEWLSPLTCVVPGQLFSHDWAVAKILDPDQPRALTKVTLTR